jgi:hypothetical protein
VSVELHIKFGLAILQGRDHYFKHNLSWQDTVKVGLEKLGCEVRTGLIGLRLRFTGDLLDHCNGP